MANLTNQAKYIGLDIGSNSVGWAVTDENYELCRFHGKDMWGSRLFDEPTTAAKRRSFRIGRRRLQRRNQRLELLQSLFIDAINAIDPSFFQRMEAARLLPEDKAWKYTLFQDPEYTDKHYHKQYPTIYHLRYDLMTQDKPVDVRLVYLACHHILKNRGHFLSADIGESGLPEFEAILDDFNQECDDINGFSLQCTDLDALKEIMLSQNMRTNDKQKAIAGLFSDVVDPAYKKAQKEWFSVLIGKKGKLAVLFSDESLSDTETKDVDFSDAAYEEKADAIEETLGSDRMHLLELWRSLYNWAVLKRLLGGFHSLSEAKVALYRQNESDLKKLKQLVKMYGSKEQYNHIFQDINVADNYAAYTGHSYVHGQKVSISGCSQSDFCKFIAGEIKDYPESDEVTYIRTLAGNGTLLPKLASKDNSIIPYQLHKRELEAILHNAEKHLPFLCAKDEDGLTVSEKILSILEFRIPYYVGPLNRHSKNSWFERKESGKIFPWNFEKKVDTAASARQFINRMTCHCTYLPSCDVLPACSPLYERYCVLNELNTLTVKGEHISVEIKQALFEQVFTQFSRPSISAIKRVLSAHGFPKLTNEDLGGVDVVGGIKSSLRTTNTLTSILGNKYEPDLADRIVQAFTYFGDDRRLLRTKLQEEDALSSNNITQIMTKLRCSGWGRLSKEFLTDIRVPNMVGGSSSILDALWETNEPLMGLLSNRYGYIDAIESYNNENEYVWTEQRFIQELYVSPVVKRQLNQAIIVVKELRKIIGHDPAKIFVEVAREEDKVKTRKLERKLFLLDMYKTCKTQEQELYESLEKTPADEFRRDKLYLYYTQMGKCMYTGEPIALEDLFNENLYDIDHIFPRSRVKDDSLDNRVLVKKQANMEKTNDYPLSEKIRSHMKGYWSILLKNGMISRRKYDRLIRAVGFTDDELAGFVSRQLVETRQSTKAVAELLRHILPESEIVYVKAGLISDFRRDRDMLKVREINDIHHAKDAYLNIVVGNVYNTEFTHSPLAYIQRHRDKYTVNEKQLLTRMIKRNGIVAWDPADNGTIATVRRVMARNSPLVSVMPIVVKGALFKVQPLKKGNGQMPLKKDLPIERYGGYNKVAGACFMLVEHTVNNKRIRSIIDQPIYLMSLEKDKQDALLAFCRNERNLTDPTIILPVIKTNALINLDGLLLYLRGRTGEYLTGNLAFQVMFGYEDERYIKRVLKYNQDADAYEHTHKNETYKVSKAYAISSEQNQSIYNKIVEKLQKKPYTSLSTHVSAAKELTEASDNFANKPVENQCRILKSMLSLFDRKCNSVDLTDLGMSKNVGLRRPSRCLDKVNTAQLIHLSPTGLYEEVIDLKTIK